MKKSILSIAAAAILATVSSADAVQMVNAGVGYNSYEYTDAGWDTFTYTILDLSYNIGWERFYISANAMLPLTDGKSDENEEMYKTALERYQYSVNFGYRLNFYNLSIFSGINYMPSTLTVTQPGNVVEVDLTETGLHLGLAGSLYTVENIGTITAKIAISQGTLDINGDEYDGIGYLYGLGWIGEINYNMNYYINLDGYNYSYDDLDSSAMTIKAGIGYMF